MDVNEPLVLLGGLTPQTFMRRHWQKKPLVIRQAIPGFVPPVGRAELFEMAAFDDVESRLVVQGDTRPGKGWQFRRGPFGRRSLPAFKQPGWTLLVQGVDLHDQRVHELMGQFRFLPDARLDDVMVSYASDKGGVGPHFDRYDVFLLQAHGQRRWRIGRQKDRSLVPDLPLKILSRFEPESEFVLDPGDMLYLPPGYAHDGIAQGECLTYSIGFRAPSRAELAGELMQRLADDVQYGGGDVMYRDARQGAVEGCAAIPIELQAFAGQALNRVLEDRTAVQRVLGEYLTEPKASVCFAAGNTRGPIGTLKLDRCTRMMYDTRHIFVNGESYLAAGRDVRFLHSLANERTLSADVVQRFSRNAKAWLSEWISAGWMHGE